MDLNFVLCPRFHGATTLALLLNNHAKVSSLADMFPSSEFDQSCGCGNKVSQCPFWGLVERKFRPMSHDTSRSLYPSWPQLMDQTSINDNMVNMISLVALYTTPRIWQASGRGAERFIEFYIDFMRTINEYSNTSIFVNGRKSLKSVLAIKSVLGDRAQINIIHLVRDPRGFYCSENKDDPDIGIEESARRWRSYHGRVIKFVKPVCNARYLPVRYEDLCEQPKSTMAKVFEFIGVEYENVFHPSVIHHLVGHASKDRFDGTLHQSLRWTNELSDREQERCLAVTQPVSERFGYKMVSRH